MNNPLSQISSYFRALNAEDVRITESEEEKSPDIAVGGSDNPISSDYVVYETVTPHDQRIKLFNHFLDGIQRTVINKQINFPDFKVPIHITHISAGIMSRNINTRNLSPNSKISALIILGPFRAIEVKTGKRLSIRKEHFLDHTGDIYKKIQSKPLNAIFCCDTSFNLGANQKKIDPSLLGQVGLVRSKALNRVRVLRAILELGLAWDFHNKNPVQKLVIDGPLVNLETYKRLISKKYLQTINKNKNKYNFLKQMVGSVKTVIRTPNRGTPNLLKSTKSQNFIYGWKLGDVTSNFPGRLGDQVISVLLQLRPELLSILPDISSSYSALVRFDIPTPLIIPDGSILDNYHSLSKSIKEILELNLCRKRFKEILSSLLSEKWIYPQKNSHRSLVELYPIEQTEKWLLAETLSPFALKSMIT